MRALGTFVLLLLSTSLMAQVAVINASLPEEPLDAKRMAALLLGRVTTWSNGSPVVLVLASDGMSDQHLKQIVGRDHTLLERGWKRLVFAGTGAMPLTAGTAEEALRLVATNPGAVVLLDQAPPDSRWRVIPITVLATH